MPKHTEPTVPAEIIEQKIYLIRGHKVMLDSDLAQLYGVPTKVFNQAVKRNTDRFPGDFMFQLNKAELEKLEVTNCDLQTFCKDGSAKTTVCFYRTRHLDAMQISSDA